LRKPTDPDPTHEPDIAPLEGPYWKRFIEVTVLCFTIGATGFGGPAVLIAMMEDEFVQRRKWISRQYFLDLVGATNLIPGPNSVEMSMHIGKIRAGMPGLFAAGIAFVVPAVAITLALAYMYARFGSLPAVAPFLYGVKPVIVAVIASAVLRLGKPAVKNWHLALIGAVVVVATLLGLNEVIAMLGGGILGMLWLQLVVNRTDRKLDAGRITSWIPWVMPTLAVGGVAAAAEKVPVTLSAIWWFFLKIGAVLYGSGYVLIAFIQRGIVDDLGWLTQPQVLDAVAAGQITPGPFTSTAAFIGYYLMGVPGGIVAAAGIFTPSFILAYLLNPLVPRLRKSTWTAAFLDAVNVASVGLMAAVTVELALATLLVLPLGPEVWMKWPTWVIALLAGFGAIRLRISPTWLVVAGSLVGWLLGRFTGYA